MRTVVQALEQFTTANRNPIGQFSTMEGAAFQQAVRLLHQNLIGYLGTLSQITNGALNPPVDLDAQYRVNELRINPLTIDMHSA